MISYFDLDMNILISETTTFDRKYDKNYFFHSHSASPIVASYIGKRTKPIWYAIEAFVVLHHVVCGLVRSLAKAADKVH